MTTSWSSVTALQSQGRYFFHNSNDITCNRLPYLSLKCTVELFLTSKQIILDAVGWGEGLVSNVYDLMAKFGLVWVVVFPASLTQSIILLHQGTWQIDVLKPFLWNVHICYTVLGRFQPQKLAIEVQQYQPLRKCKHFNRVLDNLNPLIPSYLWKYNSYHTVSNTR